MTLDGTDSELEVAAVRGRQLDDGRNDAAATISTGDDDAGRVSTSELVIARRRRVPRVTAYAALTAVHRPLSLNVTTTGSPLVIEVEEDTEDSKPKDGRRWSINRNPT